MSAPPNQGDWEARLEPGERRAQAADLVFRTKLRSLRGCPIAQST